MSLEPLREETCTKISINNMRNSRTILAEVFLQEKFSLKERSVRENLSANVCILIELQANE